MGRKIERRGREDLGTEVVGCGEGLSPSSLGIGLGKVLCPSTEKN